MKMNPSPEKNTRDFEDVDAGILPLRRLEGSDHKKEHTYKMRISPNRRLTLATTKQTRKN